MKTQLITKKAEAKSSHLERVGDIVVGCGVYREQAPGAIGGSQSSRAAASEQLQ